MVYSQLEGGFGSARAILYMCGLGAKNGSKTETKKNEKEVSFSHHSIRLDELIIFGSSDVKIKYLIKKARAMPIPHSKLKKSGVLAYFGLKIGYFGHIF